VDGGAPSGNDEVDLPALRARLADLSHEVSEAQARVVGTIEAKHTEFVAAFDQIADLRSTVTRLRTDIRDSSTLLGQSVDPTSADAAKEEEAPGAKLRRAVGDRAALLEEAESFEAATLALTAMLEAQRQFGDIDEMMSKARYREAAEVLVESHHTLAAISAPDEAMEPALLKATKLHYMQRRAFLSKRLDGLLSNLCGFDERCATVCSQGVRNSGESSAANATELTTLPQVWEALNILDLRNSRVEQLAAQAFRWILHPLLEASRRLPPGRLLKPRVYTPEEGSVAWTFVEEEEEEENVAPRSNILPTQNPLVGGEALNDKEWRPKVHAVLSTLDSFLDFAHLRWACGIGEVYGALGRKLWPPIARCLVQHFDTRIGDGGESLEHFETTLLHKGLFGTKENTLARHVHEQRHAIGERRRAGALAEAREWLLREDGTVVKVCDATEPGSITQLLKEQGGRLRPEGASSHSADVSEEVKERLWSTLRDDDGFLRLPEMHVSTTTHRLVGRLRSLMDEVCDLVKQGRIEAARDVNKLVREICTLFAVLRPYAQKAKLKSDPKCCAALLTDCLYIVHVWLLMPYTYGRQLPEEHRPLSFFVDLVPAVRRLGETHFLEMMRHQHEQIRVALLPCDFSAGIARDRVFVAAEAALGSAMQLVKSGAQGMSQLLPAQLLHEVTGLLLGLACRSFLGAVFRVHHASPEEVTCISTLLMSAVSMGRQAYLAAVGVGLEKPSGGRSGGPSSSAAVMERDVPGWAALVLTSDLLGSDFSRFLERRAQVVKSLSRDEAMKLLQLSIRDDKLSPQDAWDTLNASMS